MEKEAVYETRDSAGNLWERSPHYWVAKATYNVLERLDGYAEIWKRGEILEKTVGKLKKDYSPLDV